MVMARLNHARSVLRTAAYREAGHAVAALEYGQRIARLSILQREDSLGTSYLRGLASLDLSAPLSPAAKDLLERRVLTVLSGPAAERWFQGHQAVSEGYDSQLADVAARMHRSAAVARAYLEYLHARVNAWLAAPATQRSINLLATALVARQAITAREARLHWQRAQLLPECRRPEPIPFPA